MVGPIEAGLFVRFADVFEGFLPVRLLGRERFEPSPLGTALVGRDDAVHASATGPQAMVERIDIASGPVALRPAEADARSTSAGAPSSRRS